jgi:hypothetical protein
LNLKTLALYLEAVVMFQVVLTLTLVKKEGMGALAVAVAVDALLLERLEAWAVMAAVAA